MKKRVLITGVAGSIGSELARQLHKSFTVYGLDINETGLFDVINETGISGRVGDIRDEMTVRDVFSDIKPHIVFHTAAYKHVPLMEVTPIEAAKTNIMGSLLMLHYSKVYPVEKFVFVSTDKAVNPKSVMGVSKTFGEIATKNSGKGFIVVRFGNVMGSRGSVIPIWQRQADRGEDITVTDERMERYMMTIPEAVELLVKAAEIGEGGEIIVLDMGERVRVLEIAEEIAKRSNRRVKIIGMRPGEQLVEEIMSEEEKRLAKKTDKFYVIR